MNTVQCPVCTLYLREGITLKEHLDTHPKDKVIEALVSSSEQKAATVVNQSAFQNPFIQPQFQINNHVPSPMQFSIIQPNPEQIQTPQGVFVPNLISNRRYIVSQPGAIIKDVRSFQRQSHEKLFTTVPAQFCNQIITTPQYAASTQVRTPQSHILTSNTQNINTQGGPAIIYSQLPQEVQSVPNVQESAHFQSVHNFQSQSPVVVPQASSISTSIGSNAQFGNSTLQTYGNSLTPVQSNKTSSSVNSLKDTTPTVVQLESNAQTFCNASTQVTTAADDNGCNSDNEAIVNAQEQYDENKTSDDIKADSENNEPYEYFDDTGAYEMETIYSGDSTDEITDLKEEPDNIESTVEDDSNVPITQAELNKPVLEDGYFDEKDVASTPELKESSELHPETNIQCDDELKYDSKLRESIEFDEMSCEITDEIEDLQEEIFESKIDIKNNDFTLESVHKNEQDKEMDLSKSEAHCNDMPCLFDGSITKMVRQLENKNKITISCVNYTNHQQDGKKKELDHKGNVGNSRKTNEIQIKKPNEVNQVSISCVTYNDSQNTSERINKAECEIKQKNINYSKVLESEKIQTKKQKVVSNDSVSIIPKPSKVSTPTEGITDFKIEEVMFGFKAFGNITLEVHRLNISNLKQEVTEEIGTNNENKLLPNSCEYKKPIPNLYEYKKPFFKTCHEYKKPIPSTSNTPGVTLHLLSKIKTEPDIGNQSNSLNKAPKVEDNIQASTSNTFPYQNIQRGRLKKPVKILKIKNAKPKEPVEHVPFDKPSSSTQSSQSSVIQHPVKTEPPPPYDTKHGVLFCQPGTSTSTASHFPAIDILPVPSLPAVDITPSKYLPSPTPHSPSLQDYTDLVNNTKLDRLTNLHHTEYDNVDTPHWLLRGINILPRVIEDDRISCASPKTLLNLDHQTSFQTFEPDDSGSTSINMQTDEMMPPRGELSGQESLESSVWGYQVSQEYIHSNYIYHSLFEKAAQVC